MSNNAVFDDCIRAAATELFQSHGIELRAAREIQASIEYGATIGFSADEIRGTAGIGLNPATLARLVAAGFENGPGEDPQDWLGEAANQLIGRLKNKLLAYGIVISPGLPTVLRGVQLELRPAGLASFWTYGFEMTAGSFCVWVDAVMAEGIVFALLSDPEFQAAREGEFILF